MAIDDIRLPGLTVPAAIWGRVLVPRQPLGNRAGSESARYGDLLWQEQNRMARQRARGLFAWHLRWLLSRRFRWGEEKACVYAVLRKRLQEARTPSEAEFDGWADRLGADGVFGLTDRHTARRFLEAAIRELGAQRSSA